MAGRNHKFSTETAVIKGYVKVMCRLSRICKKFAELGKHMIGRVINNLLRTDGQQPAYSYNKKLRVSRVFLRRIRIFLFAARRY